MKRYDMKKYIPWNMFYCYDCKHGICPWYKDLSENKNANKLREQYCNEKPYCDTYKKYKNCEHCDMKLSDEVMPEFVTRCKYLNVIEIGQYPLGDQCKICNIHTKNKYGW